MMNKIYEKDIKEARKFLRELENSRESQFEKAQRFFKIQESILGIKQIQ